MQPEILLENLRERDAGDLQTLAMSVGWNFTLGQAGLFLAAKGTVLGYRHGGQLIASAGLYTYGRKLASLGIVIVHRAYQRKGFAKRIVTECLREAERADSPVTLVATEQGFPLYQSLGFRTVGQVHRFESDSIPFGGMETREANASMLEASDLLDVLRLDETAFGANRHGVYEAQFRFMHAGAVLRDGLGTVSGFAICVRRDDLLVIGPVIAPSGTVAINLVRSLCSEWKGRVRIDVPNEQDSFKEQLLKWGFREKMVSPVMIFGATHLPGARSQLFGLADPVFG
ncbi:GNAT family N-acetyltransferase [Alicyclobacillus sp. ALC3]|uniref:GNAT family N-acetyltransferase n=1 Tax=Alicyclobacillus sp. ALC3 TaxID=2796143 RepID=UPI002378B854|nr:GNAT family N-acetyltransferase [Alicyclobacillus sp. ALC3]WDL96726.1 GNAT family N-acetyltransferase [Alicyclobacillus sp. ALC3]